MNGRTDTGEYFYQNDFQAVLTFAENSGLSRYTFWSVNRDRQCSPPGNNGVTSSECSSVTQNPWDFSAYTVAFAHHAPVTSPPTPTPTPTPTATATATATATSSPAPTPSPSPTSGPGGCAAAAWVPDVAYVSGDVVSYGGHEWTANQWNYNEVPGGAAGAWNDDGRC
jgi:chitinase